MNFSKRKRIIALIFTCALTASAQVRPALQPTQYALTQGQHGTVRVVPALLAGDYRGKLGPLHIQLHLVVSDQGDLVGTLDGPNVTGIRVDRITTVGTLLSFRVPALGATWTGTVGDSLVGTWRQGSQAQPLTLRRML